jgi:hypothetical protein
MTDTWPDWRAIYASGRHIAILEYLAARRAGAWANPGTYRRRALAYSKQMREAT